MHNYFICMKSMVLEKQQNIPNLGKIGPFLEVDVSVKTFLRAFRIFDSHFH